MAAPGRGQVKAFWDGQPRQDDGRFTYGKMASVSTASLPKDWRGRKLGQKVAYAKSQYEGVEVGHKSIGGINVTSAGLRHSVRYNSGPLKEALLCNPKAVSKAIWSGKGELLPNTKPHVADTFGITSKVKIDGKIYEAQFIVHRHKYTGDNNLYHVRLKQ